MKHIFLKYLAIATTLLSCVMTVHAQDSGVKTAKSVSGPDSQGYYTITLESFATGTTVVTETATPADIVLVLDYSNSMTARYTYKGQTTTRIAALKLAVADFVDQVAYNDTHDSKGNVRESVGNRIAVVTYNSISENLLENVSGAEDGGFLRVNTDAKIDAIKNAVNNASQRTNTMTDLGMEEGKDLILAANTSRPESSKTLVLFTDGAPGVSGTFYYDIVVDCVDYAQEVKDINGTVYTISLVNSTDSNISRIREMMGHISSNYPTASATMTGSSTHGSGITYTGTATSDEYYQDANETDLGDIFDAIAQASGASDAEVGASTQVRDVVSNSFYIPDGVKASDVSVYTAAALTETTWGDNVPYTSATITFVDADGKAITPDEDGSVDGAKAIYVQGFDFSKDDTSTGAGDGNWVGLRYNEEHDPVNFWAGNKLVIQFKLKAETEATGGAGTPTNTSESGVYILKTDDAGNEYYDCIEYFEVPHRTLTINIKIQKTGLRHGESATFEILKIRPKNWSDSKTLAENIEAMEYNIINKPLPNQTGEPDMSGSDISDALKDVGWSSFSKVILTNKGEDGEMVEKDILALDPYWIYVVIEDNWGWAYTMTGENQVSGLYTTSSIEINPFKFKNTEKTDVPKHAEAISINHFSTAAGGDSDVETYKSSKSF